ncbi:MAG: ABC transporter permease [Gaiellaceae bacterium]
MSFGIFILRRLLWTLLLIPLVMLATYALMRGSGGSPFRPPEGYFVVPETYQRFLTEFYRLDEPWFVEYANYVKNVFTFEFGPSMIFRNLDVTDVIRQSFPVTIELVLLATAWAVPIGVTLGLLAAVRRNSVFDALATSTASVMLVLPVFFVAFVFSEYLVFEWDLLPAGWGSWEAKILPSFALALAPIGYIARLVRAAAVETLEEDYVRTARAKGLRRRRVVWVHVLRNSLVPFLSAAVPMLALLVTGAFFVEQLFRIPGAASSFIEAALTRDYPLIMGLTVALAVVVLVANLISDVLLALVDPRVREGIQG